jgi:hypothetical protein
MVLFLDAKYRKQQMLQLTDSWQRQLVPFNVAVVKVVQLHCIASLCVIWTQFGEG